MKTLAITARIVRQLCLDLIAVRDSDFVDFAARYWSLSAK
jgi:hypothetical protein